MATIPNGTADVVHRSLRHLLLFSMSAVVEHIPEEAIKYIFYVDVAHMISNWQLFLLVSSLYAVAKIMYFHFSDNVYF